MKKFIFILSLFFLVIEFSGCATLKRKFTPKRKKEESKREVILALEDYDRLIDYHELYKKHYILWQYWHDELISSLAGNFKKYRQCVDQALEQLIALGKYISDEKKKTLNTYVVKLERIKKRLYGRSLNPIEQNKIVRELEKLKRLIDKEYRYSEIKIYITAPSP